MGMYQVAQVQYNLNESSKQVYAVQPREARSRCPWAGSAWQRHPGYRPLAAACWSNRSQPQVPLAGSGHSTHSNRNAPWAWTWGPCGCIPWPQLDEAKVAQPCKNMQNAMSVGKPKLALRVKCHQLRLTSCIIGRVPEVINGLCAKLFVAFLQIWSWKNSTCIIGMDCQHNFVKKRIPRLVETHGKFWQTGQAQSCFQGLENTDWLLRQNLDSSISGHTVWPAVVMTCTPLSVRSSFATYGRTNIILRLGVLGDRTFGSWKLGSRKRTLKDWRKP